MSALYDLTSSLGSLTKIFACLFDNGSTGARQNFHFPENLKRHWLPSKSLKAEARIGPTESEAVGQNYIHIISLLSFQRDIIAAELVLLSRRQQVECWGKNTLTRKLARVYKKWLMTHVIHSLDTPDSLHTSSCAQ